MARNKTTTNKGHAMADTDEQKKREALDRLRSQRDAPDTVRRPELKGTPTGGAAGGAAGGKGGGLRARLGQGGGQGGGMGGGGQGGGPGGGGGLRARLGQGGGQGAEEIEQVSCSTPWVAVFLEEFCMFWCQRG